MKNQFYDFFTQMKFDKERFIVYKIQLKTKLRGAISLSTLKRSYIIKIKRKIKPYFSKVEKIE